MIFSIRQHGPMWRWKPAGFVKLSLESIKTNVKYALLLEACQATPAFLSRTAEPEISKMLSIHFCFWFISFVLVKRWKMTPTALINMVDINTLQ